MAQGMITVKSLDVPITEHCNLKCAACDHASPHLAPAFLDVERFADDLERLSRVMRAGELRLVGGEPLQHPQLADIIAVMRSSGLAENIVLITNGLLLHQMEEEIWRAIDKLWWSIYPDVRLQMSEEDIQARCDEFGVTYDGRNCDEFRQVLVNEEIRDRELVRSIYRHCKAAHKWKCYTVSGGWFFKCTKPANIRSRLALHGLDYRDEALDGVRLDADGDLGQRIRDYLASPEPLSACRWCLGSLGPVMEHHQLKGDAAPRELAADGSAALAHARAEVAKMHQSRIGSLLKVIARSGTDK